MAFPLIPFVAGAAVGSLVTYVYKDEPALKAVKDAAEKAYASIGSGAAYLWSLLSGGAATTSEQAAALAEGPTAAVVAEAAQTIETMQTTEGVAEIVEDAQAAPAIPPDLAPPQSQSEELHARPGRRSREHGTSKE